MQQPEQDEIVSFLLRSDTHASNEAVVTLVETHAARVFLVGELAYKIKRAVAYDYLDYSTLVKRHDALTRELELNATAAPAIYRDVIPITRKPDGGLALGGAGEPVEWVLRMNRFPTENELVHVAERGELNSRLAEALGSSIARYHAMAPVRSEKSGSVLISQILSELRREFSDMGDVLPMQDIQAFHALAGKMLERLSPLLDARTRSGFVRRCHGDLHLRNIVVINGAPVPFDALEFDEELGTCDVLYDLAFLLMDLLHRELSFAANRVLNQYLFDAAMDDHIEGLGTIPLFLGVRAAISAMVAVQTARAKDSADDGLRKDGHRYLSDAISVLRAEKPSLIAIGGLSGTGKSTLAGALAPDLGPAPGAVHFRSDLIRKTLFCADPLSKLPQSAYTPEVNDRVYERLSTLTGLALRAGHTVIADAVFMTLAERKMIEQAARRQGVPFTGLWLEADSETLLSRVAGRTRDASDADTSVVRRQLEHRTGTITWNRLTAAGTKQETLENTRVALDIT